MNCIQKIEIKHFRSIYRTTIDNVSDVNVFSGLNDVGKSNVIKALNLFFNNQVDWQSRLEFERDTNSYRSYYSKKGSVRKFISVKLTFNVKPGRYTSIGASDFWIERQWDRSNLDRPIQTWGKLGITQPSLEKPRGLTDFLKACHFFYVPAIRSEGYLRALLRQFSMAITEQADKDLETASTKLSKVLRSRSSDLRRKLKDITGIGMSLELPQTMLALLEAAGLTTDGDIPLEMRGDGIQSLTVAAILTYLSSRSRKAYYFWGFEEPENSLEYKKASELADKIYLTYSKQAQIFLTTHSPAFLAMENTKTSIYRVKRTEQKYEKDEQVIHKESVTDIEPVFVRGDFQENLLPRELGILEIARKFDRDNREVEILEKRVNLLEEKIKVQSKPVLLVEGSNDKKTLEFAWKQLFSGRMPFKIIDSGGVNEVKELTKRWGKFSENKVFALFDHDKAGTSQARKLDSNIAAMTLPPPAKEGGQDQADNLNLTLEFYFPDQVLCEVNKRSGGKLFCENCYVDKGDHRENNEDFHDSTSTKMKYRLLKNEGKSYLVEHLNTLKPEDFLHFESLFKKIVSCIAPEIELKKKTIKQEALELQ